MCCLQDLTPAKENVYSPIVQVTILDGATIINMLQPGTEKTLQDYAPDVFMPYITSHLQHVTRLDIISDVYMPENLKADTRSKRGKGVRRRVDQFLEAVRRFSASMPTRRSCSPSWQRMQQASTPTNRSSPHTILMCVAQIAKMSWVWLHAPMKRLTLTAR